MPRTEIESRTWRLLRLMKFGRTEFDKWTTNDLFLNYYNVTRYIQVPFLISAGRPLYSDI